MQCLCFLRLILVLIDIHTGHKNTQHYCEYIVYVSLERSYYLHDMYTGYTNTMDHCDYIYMFLQFELGYYLICTIVTR